jgi:hypothetical protein
MAWISSSCLEQVWNSSMAEGANANPSLLPVTPAGRTTLPAFYVNERGRKSSLAVYTQGCVATESVTLTGHEAC